MPLTLQLQIWINSPNRDKLENFSQLSAPLNYLGYQSQVNYNLFYRLGGFPLLNFIPPFSRSVEFYYTRILNTANW